MSKYKFDKINCVYLDNRIRHFRNITVTILLLSAFTFLLDLIFVGLDFDEDLCIFLFISSIVLL